MNRVLAAMAVLVIAIGILSAGCTGRSATSGADPAVNGDTLTGRSALLTLVDCGDYLVADIANPWMEGRLARYLLVPEEYAGALPDGDVVRIPLRRSVVFSSVYGGAAAELGAINAVCAVADGQYFKLPAYVSALADGQIADVGNSSSPSVERIVDCEPDGIVATLYQGQQHGAVEQLGIPVISMVDYMEPTPLGRAEWIKFIGALYGRRDRADSVYQAVEEEYESLRRSVADVARRPKVLTEQPLAGGSWDLPKGESYMGRMLADAGADYPWASTGGSGSLKLDVAAVYDRAADADYWLIRSYGPMNADALSSVSPLTARFKALRDGGLYVCDTSMSPIYDEFPFHPERLLREYITIFHPEKSGGSKLRYYSAVR